MFIFPITKTELVKIKKVIVLEDGRLAIYPEKTSNSYEYIYREAAGVYWDRDEMCFQSTIPQKWDYGDWFSQIVSVVFTGLNIRLILSDETIFNGLNKTQIISSNDDVQDWINLQANTKKK